MDREKRCAFGLPLHLDETTMGEFLQHAFQGGEGNMSQVSEVFVTYGASGFGLGMSQPPQPEVDRLFRGSEVPQDLIDDVMHTVIMWLTARRKSRDRGRASSQEILSQGL